MPPETEAYVPPDHDQPVTRGEFLEYKREVAIRFHELREELERKDAAEAELLRGELRGVQHDISHLIVRINELEGK